MSLFKDLDNASTSQINLDQITVASNAVKDAGANVKHLLALWNVYYILSK